MPMPDNTAQGRPVEEINVRGGIKHYEQRYDETGSTIGNSGTAYTSSDLLAYQLRFKRISMQPDGRPDTERLRYLNSEQSSQNKRLGSGLFELQEEDVKSIQS